MSNRTDTLQPVELIFLSLRKPQSIEADTAWWNVCRGSRADGMGLGRGEECALPATMHGTDLCGMLRIKDTRVLGASVRRLSREYRVDQPLLKRFLLQVGLLLLSPVPVCGGSLMLCIFAFSLFDSQPISTKVLGLALHFFFFFFFFC
ncbi:hypothetical protein BDW71DRAFT_181360 [Aspergillus fruticulosus]